MKTLIFLILCLLIASCAPMNYKSYSASSLDSTIMQGLAEDMAEQITVNNPEKSTSFYIDPDPRTVFGGQLSQALREKGYSVIDGRVGLQKGDEKEIFYTIDWTAHDSLYSSIIVGVKRYTRGYRIVDGKLQPFSAEIIGVANHE